MAAAASRGHHRRLGHRHHRGLQAQPRLTSEISFGKIPEEFEGHIPSITHFDRLALILLAGILILIGVYPTIMAPLVESGANAVLALFGGA